MLLRIFISCLLLLTAVRALQKHAPVVHADWKKRVVSVDGHRRLRDNAYDVADHYERTNTLPNDVAALCIYTNQLNTTGWYLLEVITSPQYNDTYQAYSAGFCEGNISQQQIYDNYYNYFYGVLEGRQLTRRSLEFIDQQLYWMNQNVQFYTQDSYWQTIGLFLSQLQGLYDGYNQTQNKSGNATQRLTYTQLYYLTNWADQMDIIDAYGGKKMPKREAMCDFLIRVTSNELFTAHTTFFKYFLMLRIYKKYSFGYNNPAILNKVIKFSSRPGDLSSADDWYTFGDFVTAETSLPNWNISNYRYLHTNSAPSWIRVMVANLMANTGPKWIDIFKEYRSGTYNNQWFFVNYAEYRQQQAQTGKWRNIVWMAEEFFYLYKTLDVSDLLQQNGYIASYNMPYNQQIYNVTGIGLSEWKGYTYYTVPRAVLFEQLFMYGGYVEGMQWLLYLNANLTGFPCGLPPDYTLDSEIAPRCDQIILPDGKPKLYGLIDGKFTNNALLQEGGSWIRNGPTTSGFQYPFSWANWPQYAHEGMPQVFNFGWTYVKN